MDADKAAIGKMAIGKWRGDRRHSHEIGRQREATAKH